MHRQNKYGGDNINKYKSSSHCLYSVVTAKQGGDKYFQEYFFLFFQRHLCSQVIYQTFQDVWEPCKRLNGNKTANNITESQE